MKQAKAIKQISLKLYSAQHMTLQSLLKKILIFLFKIFFKISNQVSLNSSCDFKNKNLYYIMLKIR